MYAAYIGSRGQLKNITFFNVEIIKLENLYYLFLVFAMAFASDFLPSTIIYFIACLLFLKIIIPHWKSYFIYPLMIAFFYLMRISFNQFFIPEATVSFLLGLCTIRILHSYPKKIIKTDYLLGFLFLAGLSLFNSTLGFMLYLVLTCLLAFTLLAEIDWSEVQLIVSLKTLLKYFFLVAPLTLALFFFFPRFRSFFPSANSGLKGEIGYSLEVNNSQTANLLMSDKVAFYVEMPKVPENELYWRGRTLNYTDGYNWKSNLNYALASNLTFQGETTNYQIKYQQHFKGDVILLDVPYKVNKSQLRVYHQSGSQSFHTYVKNKRNLIKAISYKEPPKYQLNKRQRQVYLQKPAFTPKVIKDIVRKLNQKNDITVIESFKEFLVQNNFSYSLSPGPMPTMNDFIKNKQGYCTHYAALMALIFRHLNFPSRIVTGFQGGTYNDIGGHYTIRSNDAHAWVEYWHQNKWNRVDPTHFVAPMRLREGFNAGQAQLNSNVSSSFWGKWYNSLRQYYDNFNYRVSLFLDNYDKNYQKLLADKFKMNLKWFYILGFFLLAPILYVIKYFLSQKKLSLSEVDLLFKRLEKKLARKKIIIHKGDSLKKIKEQLMQLSSPKKEQALEILELYTLTKYAQKDFLSELKYKIKVF